MFFTKWSTDSISLSKFLILKIIRIGPFFFFTHLFNSRVNYLHVYIIMIQRKRVPFILYQREMKNRVFIKLLRFVQRILTRCIRLQVIFLSLCLVLIFLKFIFQNTFNHRFYYIFIFLINFYIIHLTFIKICQKSRFLVKPSWS